MGSNVFDMVVNTKPKKVLHLLTRLVRGGADENTLATIRGLMKNGYDVDLVVGGDSDYALINQASDINFIVIPELRRDLKLSNLVAFFKITFLLFRKKYSIVHTHTAMAGFLGRIASQLAFTPIVIHSLHGTTFHESLNKATRQLYIYLEILAGLCTDHFITVGEDIKEKYLARRIGERRKYSTVRSGFDYSRFDNARSQRQIIRRFLCNEIGIDEKEILIGMVSRIEPRKGHSYLLEVARNVTGQACNCRFIIVGEGNSRLALEEAIKESGLSDRFVFLGHREDIAEVMAFLDIVVLTSLWEGLPRVLVQAALLGKPIVTFKVEGATEVVEDGVNGYVVPSKNTSLMANRLLSLIQDIDKAHAMGQNGVRRVSNQWDKEVMVKNTVNIYNALIGEKLHSARQSQDVHDQGSSVLCK